MSHRHTDNGVVMARGKGEQGLGEVGQSWGGKNGDICNSVKKKNKQNIVNHQWATQLLQNASKYISLFLTLRHSGIPESRPAQSSVFPEKEIQNEKLQKNIESTRQIFSKKLTYVLLSNMPKYPYFQLNLYQILSSVEFPSILHMSCNIAIIHISFTTCPQLSNTFPFGLPVIGAYISIQALGDHEKGKEKLHNHNVLSFLPSAGTVVRDTQLKSNSGLKYCIRQEKYSGRFRTEKRKHNILFITSNYRFSTFFNPLGIISPNFLSFFTLKKEF